MYYLVYGLIILIGLFFVYYFMLGDRLDMAVLILKMIVFFGFFLALSGFKLLNYRNKLKISGSEALSAEKIAIINRRNKLFDKIVLILGSCLILVMALAYENFNIIDIYQAFSVFLMIIWHAYLFKTRIIDPYTTVSGLTFKDQISDYFAIVLLSFLILFIGIWGGTFGSMDIAQSLTVFAGFYMWHKYLFQQKGNL